MRERFELGTLPGRKVALLANRAVVAHLIEQIREMGTFGKPALGKAETIDELPVGDGEPLVGPEHGYAHGKLIDNLALGGALQHKFVVDPRRREALSAGLILRRR